jgi:hypothetical protein
MFNSNDIYDKNLLFDCMQPKSDHDIYASFVPLEQIDFGSLQPANTLLIDNYQRINGSSPYTNWDPNISHHQWRTQKEQDGAFRDMSYDPQDIALYNSTVTELPDSMDGHRLGHNWSVSWVTDYLLDNE